MCRKVPHLRVGYAKIFLQCYQSIEFMSLSPIHTNGHSKTNDFVVRFANVNGTGSASANFLFAKAIFRMGIPVSPKNIFRSEEHTSELQSRENLVCRLLLEKKK